MRWPWGGRAVKDASNQVRLGDELDALIQAITVSRFSSKIGGPLAPLDESPRSTARSRQVVRALPGCLRSLKPLYRTAM